VAADLLVVDDVSEELLQELLSEGASCTEKDGIGVWHVNGTCDLSCLTRGVAADLLVVDDVSEELLQELLSEGASCTEKDGIGVW
jgi:hypothetical protein